MRKAKGSYDSANEKITPFFSLPLESCAWRSPKVEKETNEIKLTAHRNGVKSIKIFPGVDVTSEVDFCVKVQKVLEKSNEIRVDPREAKIDALKDY